jgi:hypothetical protein
LFKNKFGFIGKTGNQFNKSVEARGGPCHNAPKWFFHNWKSVAQGGSAVVTRRLREGGGSTTRRSFALVLLSTAAPHAPLTD